MKENKLYKRLVIVAIATLMLLVVANTASAAHIQIGTGTSSAYYTPFRTFYDYSWSGMIILAEEIGGPLEINAFSFDNKGTPPFPFTQYNQIFYMKHIPNTFDQWPDGNKPDLTGLQTIYTGDVVVPGVGWHKIDFDTSFLYNGVDNLMIWFENYDGDYISPYPYWNGHTATYTTIYNYADGAFPDDTGYRTSTRANIRLHFATDHDVALTEIVTPELVEGYGDIPIQVKVKNVGLNPESFPVNVEIIQTAPLLINEDFQSAYAIRPLPPAGWLVEDTNGDGYTSGVYAYDMWGSYYSTSSSYVHSPTVSMRMDYKGATGDNDWLFTPAVSLNAGPTYYLEWWDRMSSSSTSYDNLGEVWLCSAQNSGSIIQNLWADPAMHHTTFRLDSTTFTVPSSGTYYIGFNKISGYSYASMYFDDVVLHEVIPPAAVYDQTVNVPSLAVGEERIITLPDWTVSVAANYEVYASTLLGIDENTADDLMFQVTQVGLINARTNSIDNPQPLMGPIPFNPSATVENIGDFDLINPARKAGQLPVRAYIPNPDPTPDLVYEEDFEGDAGLNEYSRADEVTTEGDRENIEYKYGDFVGYSGKIIYPEDNPFDGLGDPGDWTIINIDNDDTTWHQTDYQSSSPDNSMYHGNEVTKMYNSYSDDVLLSPPIFVGTGGGEFYFNLQMEVEGGYDWLEFGSSPDGEYFTWWFGPTSGWGDSWIGAYLPINPSDVDARGYTRIGFHFISDNIFNYEGCYIDNVEVYASPIIYDETVFVDLPAGDNITVEFPEFTPLDGVDEYELFVCCEHPKDSVPADDCVSLEFTMGAPVYILETGFGYATIQEGIDAALPGQTVVVTDGDYYEDPVIYPGKERITVTGEYPPLNTATIYGTVDIIADGVTLQYFRIVPGGLYGADEAGVFVSANDVTVQENIIEDMTGYVECDSFTIKGIHVYGGGPNTFDNIEIVNNTIRNIVNTNCTIVGDDDDDDDDDMTNIEDFEVGPPFPWSPWVASAAVGDAPPDDLHPGPDFKYNEVGAAYAHDGNYGLQDPYPSFYYRTDVSIGNPGDKLTCWTRSTSADTWGRLYFGFGASASGCHSFVVSWNTQALVLQNNHPYTSYVYLEEVPFTLLYDQWYKVEIVFDSLTQVTCNLYGSDGTSLLGSIVVPGISGLPGGVAMRGFGYTHIDTIEASYAKGSFSSKATIYGPEDFDTDDGGYNAITQLWQHGAPTYVVGSAHSAPNVWGTNLVGDYGDYAADMLHSILVDLDGYTNCELSFWHWYDTELTYDGGNVKISADGGAWQILGSYLDPYNLASASSGNSQIPGEPAFSGHGQGFWEYVTFDLSAYDGLEVEIRWDFGSDSSVGYYPGWYIDDVEITGDPAGDDDDDDDDCDDCTYGGAVGIMIQGYVEDVRTLHNDITEIHSAGWSYGIEVTPTVEVVGDDDDDDDDDECEWEVCLLDTYGDGWDPPPYYGGPNTLDVIVDGVVVWDDITILVGGGPDCYPFMVAPGDVVELVYTLVADPYYDYPEENHYIIYDDMGIPLADIFGLYEPYWSTQAYCTTPPGSFGESFAKYLEDFESDDGGWVATADWDPVGDFEWTNTYDVSNYVPGAYPTSEIPPPTAYSGTGLWGTVMYAPHTNPPTSGMMTYLSQTFDFTGVTGAEISWYSWENVFGDWDHCNLYVNGDHVWGPSWDTAPQWRQRIVDLSAYDGMSSVEIKFALSATTVVAYAGWYIDDVEVSGTGGGDDDDDDGTPVPKEVFVKGNYLRTIGNGAVYDVWNDSMAAPYPGIMFSLDELYPGASDGDASEVTVYHNFFDNVCELPVLAMINKDLVHVLNASYNYWGNPEGPASYPEDPGVTDTSDGTKLADANDFSCSIVDYGPVHFFPWIGIEAVASPETASVDSGIPVVFSAAGSWAADMGEDKVKGKCEYEICLMDSYGDGWDYSPNYGGPNLLDVYVDGVLVLDDIFLAAGYGPECGYFFEVKDGSLIECDYQGFGTYYTENSYEIFDSEGNSVALVWYSDWSGAATCPGGEVEGETYKPSYYWTFEPLYHSMEETIGYAFSSPGDYDVTLRARGNNLGTMKAGVTGLQTSFHNMWSNFMFTFAHCDIDVSNPGAPLGANADGGNLGGYETVVNVPITFHGTATGGTAPYIYEWDFGNDQTAVTEGPDITTTYKEVGTYTVTLTVYDYTGTSATDTSEVIVHNEEVMVVNIGGPYDGVIDQPVFFKGTAYGGTAPYGYLWNFGDGSIGAGSNTFHIYEEEGTYTVTLTVIDDENEEQTTTTTVRVDQVESNALVIKDIRGGILITAVIKAGDVPVDWTISVDGSVFFGGEASGTIPANLQASVKLPLTIGFGKVDITITANEITDTYTAFMLGPFVLNIK